MGSSELTLGVTLAVLGAGVLHAGWREVALDATADGWRWDRADGGLPEPFDPGASHPNRFVVGAQLPVFAGFGPAPVFRRFAMPGGTTDPQIPVIASAAFIARPYAADAVRVRLWDDLAKTPAAVTPTLAHYLAVLEAVARPAAIG